MRGDGPRRKPATVHSVPFPPHARGWTPEHRTPDGRLDVSPACAGMDPGSPTCDSANRCFPRMRGDGPLPPCATNPTSMFPPHARGWTRRPGRVGAYPGVSPACAGMDPFTMSYRVLLEGFPRMRGDGPSSAALMTVAAKFPPHARGWTVAQGHTRRRRAVSPACAGMDLMDLQPFQRRFRFPRMRGDGPLLRDDLSPSAPFPPHARGWTLGLYYEAYASMVSPACAGMDRLLSRCRRARRCFPRMRGDGPVQADIESVTTAFPPHARGWTSVHHADDRARGVSPACAGMDPCRILARGRSTSFPRMRGDGPSGQWTPWTSSAFPPHARGWTYQGREGHRSQDVSPACAGMDP